MPRGSAGDNMTKERLSLIRDQLNDLVRKAQWLGGGATTLVTPMCTPGYCATSVGPTVREGNCAPSDSPASPLMRFLTAAHLDIGTLCKWVRCGATLHAPARKAAHCSDPAPRTGRATNSRLRRWRFAATVGIEICAKKKRPRTPRRRTSSQAAVCSATDKRSGDHARARLTADVAWQLRRRDGSLHELSV